MARNQTTIWDRIAKLVKVFLTIQRRVFRTAISVGVALLAATLI